MYRKNALVRAIWDKLSSDEVPHIFYADLQVMKGKGLKMY